MHYLTSYKIYRQLNVLKYVFHFFYVITNDHSLPLCAQCEVELFFLSELTDSDAMFKFRKYVIGPTT